MGVHLVLAAAQHAHKGAITPGGGLALVGAIIAAVVFGRSGKKGNGK